MAFRNGQWVKFSGAVAGAQTAADGKIVGIFRRGSVDSTGEAGVDCIVPVDPQGNNLLTIKDGVAVALTYPPSVAGLEPVLSRDDIPAARITANPDWTPRA